MADPDTRDKRRRHARGGVSEMADGRVVLPPEGLCWTLTDRCNLSAIV